MTKDNCDKEFKDRTKYSYIVFLGVILNLFIALALYVFNWTNNSVKLIEVKERKLLEDLTKYELNKAIEREKSFSDLSRLSAQEFRHRSVDIEELTMSKRDSDASLRTPHSIFSQDIFGSISIDRKYSDRTSDATQETPEVYKKIQ